MGFFLKSETGVAKTERQNSGEASQFEAEKWQHEEIKSTSGGSAFALVDLKAPAAHKDVGLDGAEGRTEILWEADGLIAGRCADWRNRKRLCRSALTQTHHLRFHYPRFSCAVYYFYDASPDPTPLQRLFLAEGEPTVAVFHSLQNPDTHTHAHGSQSSSEIMLIERSSPKAPRGELPHKHTHTLTLSLEMEHVHVCVSLDLFKSTDLKVGFHEGFWLHFIIEARLYLKDVRHSGTKCVSIK